MTDQPPTARGYFLACYTVSLVQEETMNGGPIHWVAIKHYLKAAHDALLRKAASAVLNLKQGHPELQLWSTHSIRVTAVNMLYRKQLSDN